MTVFKCYMKILRQNIGLVIMYLAIFFSVAIVMQFAAGKSEDSLFETASIDLGVVNEDGGTLAQGLVDYLSGIHHVMLMDNNPEQLQENLFYRNVEYILQIPADFYGFVLHHGIYSDGIQEGGYSEKNGGFCHFCETPVCGRAAGYGNDRRNTVADRIPGRDLHVWKPLLAVGTLWLLYFEYLYHADSGSVPFLSDRYVYHKQQPSKRCGQPGLPCHVLPLRRVCSYGCDGQIRAEIRTVSACLLV